MAPPLRPRNRRGQGGRLRGEILAAATELLDAGAGERSMTLRAVARRAGIAAPSIYPHFLDQSAIMLAIVRQGFAELTRRLRSAAAAAEDPRQGLHAVCRTYLDYAQQYPQRYRAMFGDLRHPGDDEVTSEPRRLLADGLAACAASGHRVSTDPAVDAIALWLGLHGLAHQRAVARSYPWPADIAARVAIPLAGLTDFRDIPILEAPP
jgi:AcrR family transcriptional regulator